MKKYKINIPIYHGYLIIIISKNIKKVLKKYKEKTPDNSNDWGATTINRKNKKGMTEYICIFRPDHLTPMTIAHEAMHLTNRILNDRGISITYDNDEVECYLLGWIVKQIHKSVC